MLSKKTQYALKAMVGLASKPIGVPVMIADLAEQERLPKKFLELILLDLKSLGVVQSKKGKQGGYYLSRAPEEIKIGQIMRGIEGPLALLPCVSQSQYKRCDECVDERLCGLRLVMKDVRDATAKILDNTSLADVHDRVERERVKPEVMFHI